jgi:hypothetical protein
MKLGRKKSKWVTDLDMVVEHDLEEEDVDVEIVEEKNKWLLNTVKKLRFL